MTAPPGRGWPDTADLEVRAGLPVELPEQYRHALYFPPKVYGAVFLTGVGLYLAASAFYLKGSGDKDNDLVKRTRAALNA